MHASEDRTSKHYIGPKRPTMVTPGIYGQDMNLTGQKSVNGWRTSQKQPHIISATGSSAKPCAGYVADLRAPCKQSIRDPIPLCEHTFVEESARVSRM